MRTPFTSPVFDRPARGSHRWAGMAGALVASLLLCYFPLAVRATDPPLNMKHVQQARTALAQDRELLGYNLGVEVVDRVATLFGDLPNDELNRRAIDLLKKLPEFREVRSAVRINPDKKPAVEPGSPSRFRPDDYPSAPALPVGSLMKGPPKREPPPLTWQYAPGQAPREEARTAVATVLETDLSLDQAIRLVRQGEKRFAGLQHELRGRVVHLTGTVPTWEDAMAFARAISRLPGVERVVLDRVRTPSASP